MMTQNFEKYYLFDMVICPIVNGSAGQASMEMIPMLRWNYCTFNGAASNPR